MRLKNLGTATIFLLFVWACNNQLNQKRNPDLEYFITQFENKSIDDKGELLTETIDIYEDLINIYNTGNSLTAEPINVDNEIYKLPFKIDTTNISEILNYYKEVVHVQYAEDGHNFLKFHVENKTDFFDINKASSGIQVNFTPKTIYYRNDVVATNDYTINFNDYEKWGSSRVVDSVDIQCNVNYISDYKEVTISNNNPKSMYMGGEILLKNIKHNYAYVQISDTIQGFIELEGITREGKVVSKKYQSDTKTFLLKEQEKYAELVKALKKIRKKVYLEKLDEIDQFRNLCYNELSGLDYFDNDNDGYYHKNVFFNGEVDKIKLYFKKNSKESSIVFRSVNDRDYSTLILESSEKNDKTYKILTDQGEQIIEIESQEHPLVSWDYRYLKINNRYFHLNTKTKTLDSILTNDIVAFDNSLVAIKNINNEYELFSSENVKISDITYSKFENEYGLLFGFRKEDVYLINSEGKELRKLGEVVDLEDALEGIMFIKNKNDKYGLMNKTGDIITPMIYDWIGLFSHNLALIKKNNDGKFGFIDTLGNIALPFIYEDAYSFVDGITAVKLNKTYKLINTKGEIIVESNSSDIFKTTVDGVKYHFYETGKAYNSKGVLIVE